LGMGMMMPQMIQQAMQGAMGGQQQAPPPPQQAAPAAGLTQAAAPAPSTVDCPNCKAAVPSGAKFCLNGGNPMPQQAGPTPCAKCGTELPPGAKFCFNCGNKNE